MNAGFPFENSRMAKYITKRTYELVDRKPQRQIATEAGFRNSNMVSMLKSGAIKLPPNKIASLAKALEADPAYMLEMAIEQSEDYSLLHAIQDIYGKPITREQRVILDEIKKITGDTQPKLTEFRRKMLNVIFSEPANADEEEDKDDAEDPKNVNGSK